ncbi:hypothetical protein YASMINEVIRUS_722 [Yasminevirus sp. GU-2018]|uniref:Uncharacterized protein n=1 Tax=Yasminevirus sp. GU-2018 TaxID=2420051 RepID=A0A5K0U843_9VIRU|nr:hypothetical protein YASMINEVIRUS_722 [Yasminevirus sp. GU-2018]
MSSNKYTRNIDVSFTNNVTSVNRADPEDVVMSYASLCKTKYVGDVVDIVRSIKGCNNMCDVASKTCTSIKTVSKVKAAYDTIGEDSVIQIAHKMCRQKGDQRGGKKSTRAYGQSGGVGEEVSQVPQVQRKKTFDEHLSSAVATADKSVATVEKLADSADKLATTAVRLTDTGVKIGSALAGLYRAVKPKQDDNQQQRPQKQKISQSIDDLVGDDVTADDITANPTSKMDVLKNIKYLEDQLEQKDLEILKLAKSTKLLTSQLRVCNNKLKQSGQSTPLVTSSSSELGTGDVSALKEKIVQLEAQIGVYTKTIDDLKAQNASKLEEMKKEHVSLLKKLASDLALKKDAECKAKIEEELQKKTSVDMQKLTGQLEALIKLNGSK